MIKRNRSDPAYAADPRKGMTKNRERETVRGNRVGEGQRVGKAEESGGRVSQLKEVGRPMVEGEDLKAPRGARFAQLS